MYRRGSRKENEFLIEMVDPITGKKRRHKRLVEKNGHCNILHLYSSSQNFRFLTDIFTTLVDIKWRYNLTIFTLVYLIGWILFGVFWWLIALQNGDLVPEHINDEEWKPCVSNVYSFKTAFLFSVETQTTIGYGYRSITDECWMGIVVVVLQSVFSCVIDAVMIGCVFAKIAKPKRRAQTLVFSKNAVIAQRDGKLVLMMQLADMRRSNLFEAHIRAKFVKHRRTEEGEHIPLYQYDLNVGYEYGVDRILLVWPLVIEHVIDSSSPLYEMSPDEIKHADFEILVILEGIVASTGMTTQKRTSYLPDEILWGHRFHDHLIEIQETSYCVNYTHLHTTVPHRTPLCSAKKLYESLEKLKKRKHEQRNEINQNQAQKGNTSSHDSNPMTDASEIIENENEADLKTTTSNDSNPTTEANCIKEINTDGNVELDINPENELLE
uniref:Inward rectifier potassium channel 2-like n=1 Tax=Saccoglossus kowalevskii TaxID=10224 RepID=A0ABM0GUW3_SACKO|nr:PREDICTED: inward rectifier potassium channel 2-like [Saccoglossus kowalevskii]